MRSAWCAGIALTTVAASLNAQIPDAVWDSAAIAWDEGRYPEALTRLDRMLAAPGGARFLERAALLTGELYRTTDVAPDGRIVKWSPGGRYASVEVGQGNARHTLLLRFENDAFVRVADLPGFALAFAPGDGFAAFVDREFTVRDVALADGAQRVIPTAGIRARGLAYAPDGTLIAAAATLADTTSQLHALGPAAPVPLTRGRGGKSIIAAAGGAVIYTIDRDRIGIDRLGAAADTTGLWRVAGTQAAVFGNESPSFAWVERNGAEYTLRAALIDGADSRIVVRRNYPIAAPAWSQDGRLIAYQAMPREDWEINVIGSGGAGDRRVTHEIQHDLLPAFLGNGLLLEKIGERRHRRSYLVDLATGVRTRLFHNNTVRTVAPEYDWAPSPDGRRILIVADRDGNTISPERGVYLVNLDRAVTVDEVRARIRASLAAELDLRRRGTRMFAPVAAAVRGAVADVEVPRIDGYAQAFASFDSKHITQPGNRKAIDYIATQLRSFGYEPVIQAFEARPGVPSANVIATLRGTVDPDLTYVVSSHFDSVEAGPGADDDATGSSSLLEAARVLARRPQRATIRFAWFTGEEAGLLGSREFVRRARADSARIVGALNNDMVGWRNDARFDNTIRFSNDGIRDLQHAAATLFTNLITYDSRYYQSTDAAAFYEAWGDIVGGIGSYPILGNPHYHQSHDVLETIDQRLVAEVTKTTVASLMLMASSPSRIAGIAVSRENGRTFATWQPAKEHGVTGYRVAWGPESEPMKNVVMVRTNRVPLPDAALGGRIAVKAIMSNGTESWDWAKAAIPAH